MGAFSNLRTKTRGTTTGTTARTKFSGTRYSSINNQQKVTMHTSTKKNAAKKTAAETQVHEVRLTRTHTN